MGQAGFFGWPMLDAGLRELYVTGIMRNRLRMGGPMAKHLPTDRRIGRDRLADCLGRPGPGVECHGRAAAGR